MWSKVGGKREEKKSAFLSSSVTAFHYPALVLLSSFAAETYWSLIIMSFFASILSLIILTGRILMIGIMMAS